MGSVVIVTEEAIAKGIRRIVAVTGPEASRVCITYTSVFLYFLTVVQDDCRCPVWAPGL